MSSGSSYQCSFIKDDDDEYQGLSPKSIWKDKRGHKDYLLEDKESKDLGWWRKIKKPINVSAVKPIIMKRTAKMSAGGMAPRHTLAFKTQTNLGRDIFSFSAKGHEEEQRKAKVSAWKTSAGESQKELWEQFDEALRRFDLSYNNMMHALNKLDRGQSISIAKEGRVKKFYQHLLAYYKLGGGRPSILHFILHGFD
jgi:hypothetical protein